MRRIHIILLVLLVAIIVIQFFRPEKNLGEQETGTDFLQVSGVPDTLAAVFLNSCYDCHSNHTRYPWYNQVAPVSWYLNHHIQEAKSHLNFSTWGIQDKADKIGLLEDICDECKDGTMPLKSYLVIHRDARIGPDDIESICDWAESEAMNIISSD